MSNTLAIAMPQGAEWLVIAALGLLFFGKRLPEVGRSLGKGIVEFKKGLKGVQDEVMQVDDTDETPAAPRRLTDTTTSTPTAATVDAAAKPKYDPYTGKLIEEEKPVVPAMKFDPYTGKPVEETTAEHR
ncbi:MAG: hypothetical protein JWO31_1227 [Phycisphaerales bacterium]|nr:hypothetical protein [Phycisphaerales bacterium]